MKQRSLILALLLSVGMALGAAPARAEFRHIEIKVFGMD